MTAQNCPDAQSASLRHDPLEAGAHVPVQAIDELVVHTDPFEHSTSTMQGPPSGTEPENAVSHGGGTLGRTKYAVLHSSFDNASRHDAAAVGSNMAVPFDTAVMAADGELKPSAEIWGPMNARHVAPSGKSPQRIARVQRASTRSCTQVEALVELPASAFMVASAPPSCGSRRA
jgi:hypothetical protein